MLWAMLGTVVAFWAVFAAIFAIVVVLRRRRRARGWSSPGGGFSRLNTPAGRPPSINPKTGSPF